MSDFNDSIDDQEMSSDGLGLGIDSLFAPDENFDGNLGNLEESTIIYELSMEANTTGFTMETFNHSSIEPNFAIESSYQRSSTPIDSDEQHRNGGLIMGKADDSVIVSHEVIYNDGLPIQNGDDDSVIFVRRVIHNRQSEPIRDIYNGIFNALRAQGENVPMDINGRNVFPSFFFHNDSFN